jgi:biotin synthase-related radical SAM superfamily protein
MFDYSDLSKETMSQGEAVLEYFKLPKDTRLIVEDLISKNLLQKMRNTFSHETSLH